MKSDEFNIILIITAIIVFGLIIFFVGVHVGYNTMKNHAVKAGRAEYYLDDNNERQWRWKEIK